MISLRTIIEPHLAVNEEPKVSSEEYRGRLFVERRMTTVMSQRFKSESSQKIIENKKRKRTRTRLFQYCCLSNNKSILVYILVGISITLAASPQPIDTNHATKQPVQPLDLIDRTERRASSEELGAAHHHSLVLAEEQTQTGAEFSSTTPSGPTTLGENNFEKTAQTRDEFLKRQRQFGTKTLPNKSLIEFLENLPVLSVGQKHDVSFECELNVRQNNESTAENQLGQSKIVWLKLTSARNGKQQSMNDEEADDLQVTPSPLSYNREIIDFETTLLSLNKRLITPDKRFKISHRPPNKWTLSLNNVGPADDRTFYLCQSSGIEGGSDNSRAKTANPGTHFIGGAKLNVLVQPKIVESDTSPSLVVANELDSVRLQCKVVSEPQAQISWRREDGRQLDNLEQKFKHQFVRRPNQIISLDSSELIFDSIRREQAGAYLLTVLVFISRKKCIASNGVLSGVSQRINVQVENCRDSDGHQLESCRPQEQQTTAGQNNRSAAAQQETAEQVQTTTTQRPAKSAQTTAKQQRNWKTTTTSSSNNRQTADGNLQRPKPRPSSISNSDWRRNHADSRLESAGQKLGSNGGTNNRPALDGEQTERSSNSNGSPPSNQSMTSLWLLSVICLVCGWRTSSF